MTMWSSDRRLVGRRTRPNSRSLAVGYPSLDVHRITRWLEESLKSFARQRDITTIIPVGHGAAACIVDQDGLCLAPVGYEGELPTDLRMRYLQMRSVQFDGIVFPAGRVQPWRPTVLARDNRTGRSAPRKSKSAERRERMKTPREENYHKGTKRGD